MLSSHPGTFVDLESFDLFWQAGFDCISVRNMSAYALHCCK